MTPPPPAALTADPERTNRATRRRRLRLSVRLKLTMLYGGMFLVAGTLLIIFFYTAFENSLPTGSIAAQRALGTIRPDTAPVQWERVSEEEAKQRAELLAAELEAQRSETLKSMLEQSVLAVAVVAAAAGGAGWLMAGRVLRPVQRITETANRVADRSLHERIDLPGAQDEFKELADTFDAMLERLDRSFDSQRRFVANASHELRTPLAVNRTLLEVAQVNSAMSPELRSVIEALLTTNERTERLLDGLLTLARSENNLKTTTVDLSEIAAHTVEETAHEASVAGVTVDATPDPALTVGDPALLERLTLNLVQNAIRYNHRDGWVVVCTGPNDQPGWVRLTVTNTGPDVPAYEIDGLFEPFHRLGQSRLSGGEGAGLGLSIVRTVVRSHGGQIAATPRSGGGLEIHILLKAADADPADTGRAR